MLNILVLTGGLEDAPSTLAMTKSLRALDHRVTTLSPLFAGVDAAARSLARRLVKLSPEVDGEVYKCELYTGRNVHGVEQVFIGHPELFANASSMDEGDDAEVGARRREVFARAAADYIAGDITNSPNIVHALGEVGARAAALLADTDHEASRVLSASPEVLVAHLDMADAFIGSSETEASAVREALEARPADDREGKAVYAIADGVDAATWNPLTDARIPHRFDPVDRRGKAKSKAAMQRELSLPVRGDTPLIAVIARPDDAAGLDALVAIAPDILRNDVQIAVQVDAPGEVVAALEDLWDRFPDRLEVRTGADADLTHSLIGAADLTLCLADDAQGAREALRYGAVPIASRTASGADRLVDCDAALGSGTAFLADSLTAEALLAATRRAIGATKLDAFGDLQRRCMEQDHSCERAARALSKAYRRARPAGANDESGAAA